MRGDGGEGEGGSTCACLRSLDGGVFIGVLFRASREYCRSGYRLFFGLEHAGSGCCLMYFRILILFFWSVVRLPRSGRFNYPPGPAQTLFSKAPCSGREAT